MPKEMPNVPNVPCGVERWQNHQSLGRVRCVPNVPCGVESEEIAFKQAPEMHRS